MKRSGFKRPQLERKPQPAYAPVERRGNYVPAMVALGTPAPKTVPHRNPFLLGMAKGERCLLEIPGVCCGNRATVVACHSNQSIHGKAGARKADDQWTVWGCITCHTWLDQGMAPAEEKARWFQLAHNRMVHIWWDIVGGMQPATPRERAAAQWALDRVTGQAVK